MIPFWCSLGTSFQNTTMVVDDVALALTLAGPALGTIKEKEVN